MSCLPSYIVRTASGDGNAAHPLGAHPSTPDPRSQVVGRVKLLKIILVALQVVIHQVLDALDVLGCGGHKGDQAEWGTACGCKLSSQMGASMPPASGCLCPPLFRAGLSTRAPGDV